MRPRDHSRQKHARGHAMEERDWKTLADIVRTFAQTRANATAFSFEGRDTSFAEFDRHTDQVSNALLAHGVKKGERICYIGKNSDHYFELFLGAAKAGAVMTPIGWRLAPPEAAYIVNDSKARLLFVGPEVTGAAKKVLEDAKGVEAVIAMEGGVPEWKSF